MLAGDTHGDLRHLSTLYKAAERQEEPVDAIFVLGDWGYTWPGRNFQAFFDDVSRYRDATGTEHHFLFGNHDNYEWLRSVGAYDARETVEVAPGAFYHPRGDRWEWGGATFLSVGGAVSIDREQRMSLLELASMYPSGSNRYGKSVSDMVDWWPEEVITEEDVEACAAGGEVDVVLSHDAPNNPVLQEYFDEFEKHYRIPYKQDELSKASREKMDRIVAAVRPGLLVHGHYHHRYGHRLQVGSGVTEVHGLSCNGNGQDSWAVIDPATYASAGR